MSCHVAHYFPHKVELVLVQQSEVPHIQDLWRLLDEGVSPETRGNVLRMDIAGHFLVESHSIRLHSHTFLEPIQSVSAIFEHLVLEGRLEEQVVVVVLGEGRVVIVGSFPG